MFAKVPVVFATIFCCFFAFAAATPAFVARGGPTLPPASSPTCGNTDIQCCQHVDTAANLTNILKPIIAASNPLYALLFKLGLASVLDVVLTVVGTVDVVVAAQCSTLSVLGGQCSAQSVCCQGTQFNGLINVGCTAIGI
ncbi:hypothetical protein ONZ45_g6168 [Pleurotus djamor]|nr:hypothetical protein ONZ45_g6168 [Pleurotus djamor]